MEANDKEAAEFDWQLGSEGKGHVHFCGSDADIKVTNEEICWGGCWYCFVCCKELRHVSYTLNSVQWGQHFVVSEAVITVCESHWYINYNRIDQSSKF